MATRNESYPKGKNGSVTKSLGLRLPGSRDIATGREGTKHPRSAAHCAEDMGPIAPGSQGKKTSVIPD